MKPVRVFFIFLIVTHRFKNLKEPDANLIQAPLGARYGRGIFIIYPVSSGTEYKD